MTAERWAEIKSLFEQARELPPAERAAWLRAQCAADETLHSEVAALLGAVEQAAKFIERPVLEQYAAEFAAEDSALIGRQLGHYLIEAEIGRGGMGEVYRAVDQRLGRAVAIKVLPAEFTLNVERVRRFEREARTISALKHPNIVTLFELFSYEGRHLIVTELVEGETLRKALARGPLDWREAVRVATQVAAALAAAHSAGIIHRDIKPANVMRQTGQAAGHVKVLDFGIAKVSSTEFVVPPSTGLADEAAPPEGGITDSDTANLPLTTTGATLGTPGYLSPEQACGNAQAQPDIRTDIFSLGVVLFELVTGRLPFPGETIAAKIKAVLSVDEAPDVRAFCPDVPAALSAIITKALRKDPEQRYASARELHTDLEELKEDLAGNDPARAGEQFRTQTANRLLTQFALRYRESPKTRIPLRQLWTIRRAADLPRGRIENKVLRKSLRGGLTRLAGWLLVITLVATGLAAGLSITERYGDERILRDGHADQVRQIALSPDGRTLVSVGNDNKAIVWDLARRERRATLTTHTYHVSAVAFAPSGKWFATAGADEKVIVWDTTNCEKIATVPATHRGVDAIAFTADERLLIAPGRESDGAHLDLWETKTWQKIGELPSAGAFLLSPDNRLLVSTVATYDLATGKEFADDFDPTWTHCALSPDALRLATVDGSGFLDIWDVSRFWRTGERQLLNRLPAHRDRGRAVAYSSDGRMIATGGENVIVWDARTFTKLARFAHKSRVNDLVFSNDARQVISAHGDGAILAWDIAEKEPRANFAEHCASVRAVRFSPDGQSVASASEDGSIIVWDAALGVKKAVLLGHRTQVSAVAFAPDGKRLASIDLSGTATIWDIEQRAPVRTIIPVKKREDLFGYAVAISPDGQWLTTSFGIYALADGRMAVEFIPDSDGQYQEVYDAAFSPDGRWLAVVTPNRGLLLWKVGTWQLHQPTSLGQWLTSVSFSPDSQWLVTGESQTAVRLWQVEPLREVAVLGRHNGFYIRSVAFSPDGRTVASASDDQTIALWDVAGRHLINKVGTHTSPVLTVAFSPDGQRIVSGEQDKSVRLYTRRRMLWGRPLD